jgi:hypothetical protein
MILKNTLESFKGDAMNLSVILDEINQQKKIAQQDLNVISPKALPYKKGQVNSAKQKLEDLYVDYKNELLKSSVFILVTGDESESFASIAEEKFKCFSVDGKSMFKEMLEKVNPQLYKNKKVNAFVFEVLGNVLEDKMKTLDIKAYNQLIFDAKYSIVTKDENEMLNVITSAVTDIVGSEVVGLDALERITQKAVNKNYKSKIVPILIHSQDEGFIDSITAGLKQLNPKVIKVSAGKTKTDLKTKISLEEVNEKSIEEALKTIAANA